MQKKYEVKVEFNGKSYNKHMDEYDIGVIIASGEFDELRVVDLTKSNHVVFLSKDKEWSKTE